MYSKSEQEYNNNSFYLPVERISKRISLERLQDQVLIMIALR
jgi:hypothetical protein